MFLDILHCLLRIHQCQHKTCYIEVDIQVGSYMCSCQLYCCISDCNQRFFHCIHLCLARILINLAVLEWDRLTKASIVSLNIQSVSRITFTVVRANGVMTTVLTDITLTFIDVYKQFNVVIISKCKTTYLHR